MFQGPHLGFLPNAPGNGISTLALDAANKWIAFSFVGNGKTLSVVRLFTSALTGTLTAAQLTCDIYSSTSAGLPNASVNGPTNCDAVPSSGWNSWSPAFATTAGTLYWVVIKNTHGTPASNNVTFRYGANQTGPASLQAGQWGWNKCHTTDGSTWGTVVLGTVGVQLDWSDATYDGAPISNMATGGAAEGVFGTAEAGNYFVVTGATINVRYGVAFIRNVTGTPSNALRMRIYSGSSTTPTLVATSQSGPVQGQTGIGYFYFRFASVVALAAGAHRVVIGTTGADANTNRYNSTIFSIQNLASSKSLMPLGMKRTYSSDGTTFTNTDTEIVPIGLVLENGSETTVPSTDYPGVGDVRDGVTFNSGGSTGTLVVPAEADVQSGVGYGTGGTEFTGTFTAPAVGDVQEAVTYGGGGTEFTGTFVVPAEADVADAVGYGASGTEFTGTLTGGGDWTSTEKEQIRYRLGIDGTTDIPATNTTHLDVNVVEVNGDPATTDPDISDAADRILLAVPAASAESITGVTPSLRSGTCQAGSTSSTIVLDAGASATNNFYAPCLVLITSGTGAGQGPRIMRVYTGATQTGTVVPTWTTTPDNTSVFRLIPAGAVQVESWRASQPNVLISGRVDGDMGAISTDSAAADNAESFFDGTGYAGTNNVIPTVTTLTNKSGFSLASTGLDLVVAWTTAITGNITGNLSGSVGSVTGAVGSVVGGINTGSGVITTLDALDTAQDTQHGTTQAAVAAIPTAAQNAAGLLDLANGVETGLTFRQAQKLMAAAAAGKLSGAATTTIVIRNAVADDKDRITATVDADGNRSAITLDLT